MMGMKKLITILAFVFFGAAIFAQNPEAKEKIESARIGFITERLGLTPEQAERFWPLYKEYRTKNVDAATRYRQYRAGVDVNELTDDQSQRLVEMELDVKQQRLDLEKEYSKKMLDVISTQQVASLRKAEKDFRGILLRRLQQARQNKMRQQMHQNRDQQFRDRVRSQQRD